MCIQNRNRLIGNKPAVTMEERKEREKYGKEDILYGTVNCGYYLVATFNVLLVIKVLNHCAVHMKLI